MQEYLTFNFAFLIHNNEWSCTYYNQWNILYLYEQ